MLVWCLLFFNVLGSGTGTVLHIPHSVEQVMTQGALVLAFVIALSVNPRVRVRSNPVLVIYSLLAVLSLTMSIRFVSLGTDYRAFRLALFIVVLWLVTPWWGSEGAVLLRAQLGFLAIILGSVVLGAIVAPGLAFPGGRLNGAVWSIPATQVAHYGAEMAGVTALLWVTGVVRRRYAVPVILVSVVILLLSHTRTALVAGLVGLAVAGISLFTTSRRVRRAFTAVLVAVAVLGIPLAPVAISFMIRGESAKELTTLTGRTQHWQVVFDEQRPETNKLFGSGMSNDTYGGLAIDSTWVDVYQNQGLVGDVLVACVLICLLLIAALRPRSPARAVALFLIVYCILASFTEDGLGEASQYMLDLVLAASLLVPSTDQLRLRAPVWLGGRRDLTA